MSKLLVCFLALFPVMAMATVAEEVSRFEKCYALFVRERLNPSDVLLTSVKNGQKSGTDACMEIFDRGALQTNNEIRKYADGNYDYEGARVLRTFNDLHRRFFEVREYHTGIDDINYLSVDVIDLNEPAYHWTYSLFKPNERFANLVTRSQSFRATRFTTMGSRIKSIFGGDMKFEQGETGTTTPTIRAWSPTVVPTGLLVGLKPDTVMNRIDVLPNHLIRFNGANVNQPLGAGVVGTQAYLLGNMGKTGNNDGALELYRRWGKHVVNDLLCRDFPALRSSDVLSEVYGNSSISFRRGISCMGCHSAMDPLAAVIRDMSFAYSHSKGERRVSFLARRAPDQPAQVFPTITRDSNFYRRPTEGRLKYRSYNGELIDVNLTGLQHLGEELAETDDLYVCAAKKYYGFLTGIKASLADPGDLNTPELSGGEQLHRQRVIDLGLELKQHQNLRTMIKKIIGSKTFLYPDKGV